jgi:hypothetical protein
VDSRAGPERGDEIEPHFRLPLIGSSSVHWVAQSCDACILTYGHIPTYDPQVQIFMLDASDDWLAFLGGSVFTPRD